MSDRLKELQISYAGLVEALEEEKDVLGEYWETTDQLELELTKRFLKDLHR